MMKTNTVLETVPDENNNSLHSESTQLPETTTTRIKNPKRLVDKDEIQIDPVQPQDMNMNNDGIKSKVLDQWRTKYVANNEALRQREGVKEEPTRISDMPPDVNLERQYLEQHFNTYEPPNLCPEVLLTNKVVKSTVQALNEINDGLNLGIEKNEELGRSWEKHKLKLNKFLESLNNMPWNKMLKVGACVITIGAFLWQMAAMRSIPQFVSTAISAIPMPNLISNIEPPKPKLDTTLQTLMEVPLTPIAIVTSIGGLSIGLLILKGLAWAIRRSPK